MADASGRKVPYTIGLGISVITYTAILLINDINIMYLLLGVYGLASGLRVSLGYVYMMEFVPDSSQPAVGSAVLFFEALTMDGTTLYFQYISNQWRWLQLFGLANLVFGLAAALFLIPESPKFFIM